MEKVGVGDYVAFPDLSDINVLIRTIYNLHLLTVVHLYFYIYPLITTLHILIYMLSYHNC